MIRLSSKTGLQKHLLDGDVHARTRREESAIVTGNMAVLIKLALMPKSIPQEPSLWSAFTEHLLRTVGIRLL